MVVSQCSAQAYGACWKPLKRLLSESGNGPNHRAKATVLMGSVGLAVIPMRYERHFEGAIKALDKGLTVFFQKCLSNPCHGEMD